MKLSIAIVTALVATVSARFDQQNPPIEATINSFGQTHNLPGQIGGPIASLSGNIPSSLLAKADACDQLKLADQLIALGKSSLTDPTVLAAYVSNVREYAHAEMNFNPFLPGAAPKLCADATLPQSAELKGILPLVDPSRGGHGGISAAACNTLTAQLLNNPAAAQNAQGMSVVQQMVKLGFLDFVGNQNGEIASGTGSSGSSTSSSTPSTPPSAPPSAPPSTPPSTPPSQCVVVIQTVFV